MFLANKPKFLLGYLLGVEFKLSITGMKKEREGIHVDVREKSSGDTAEKILGERKRSID